MKITSSVAAAILQNAKNEIRTELKKTIDEVYKVWEKNLQKPQLNIPTIETKKPSDFVKNYEQLPLIYHFNDQQLKDYAALVAIHHVLGDEKFDYLFRSDGPLPFNLEANNSAAIAFLERGCGDEAKSPQTEFGYIRVNRLFKLLLSNKSDIDFLVNRWLQTKAFAAIIC